MVLSGRGCPFGVTPVFVLSYYRAVHIHRLVLHDSGITFILFATPLQGQRGIACKQRLHVIPTLSVNCCQQHRKRLTAGQLSSGVPHTIRQHHTATATIPTPPSSAVAVAVAVRAVSSADGLQQRFNEAAADTAFKCKAVAPFQEYNQLNGEAVWFKWKKKCWVQRLYP